MWGNLFVADFVSSTDESLVNFLFVTLEHLDMLLNGKVGRKPENEENWIELN